MAIYGNPARFVLGTFFGCSQDHYLSYQHQDEQIVPHKKSPEPKPETYLILGFLGPQ